MSLDPHFLDVIEMLVGPVRKNTRLIGNEYRLVDFVYPEIFECYMVIHEQGPTINMGVERYYSERARELKTKTASMIDELNHPNIEVYQRAFRSLSFALAICAMRKRYSDELVCGFVEAYTKYHDYLIPKFFNMASDAVQGISSR